jgi:hypothetical protein
MKPSLGRTVLFTLPPEYWDLVDGLDRIRPAIVTRVLDPDDAVHNRVNLRVIHDPTDVFMVSKEHQTFVEEGAGTAGRWFWPPRV